MTEGRREVTRIYRILPRRAWEAALAAGCYDGSALDRADGFIHFSTADQAPETARLHFRGQGDLMVLAVEAGRAGAALRWEASRGGDLFPRLYGPLPCEWVVEARPASLGPDGVPNLGELVP